MYYFAFNRKNISKYSIFFDLHTFYLNNSEFSLLINSSYTVLNNI